MDLKICIKVDLCLNNSNLGGDPKGISLPVITMFCLYCPSVRKVGQFDLARLQLVPYLEDRIRLFLGDHFHIQRS